METPLRQLSWLTSPYTRSKSVGWRPRSDRLFLLLIGEHRLKGVPSCKSNVLFFRCLCYNSDLFDIRVSWRGWNEDFLLRTCVFSTPFSSGFKGLAAHLLPACHISTFLSMCPPQSRKFCRVCGQIGAAALWVSVCSSAQPGFRQRAGSGNMTAQNHEKAEKYQLVGEKLTAWKRVLGV